MATRFVPIDRDTPLLLPPNLRDWVAADHLVHFISDAVEAIDLRQVRVNTRGTGSEQYPPHMMLSLLIYSYATGNFSSRGIEKSTYDSVPVRVLTADTHPDHDTICNFRRENKALLSESFVKVLQLAQELKLLKFGQITVATDGTKVLANASKHSAVSYQRAGEVIERLDNEVKELMAKVEQADSTPLQDGLS
ncbi:MAG: transposase, partial [Verrucomicrobia bacterium]|nr:transposase [Verrucomicrobiota bacterium]